MLAGATSWSAVFTACPSARPSSARACSAGSREASKVALVHLVLRLIKGGYSLLDTQFTTPHLRQFGAVELPREAYKMRLAQALSVTAQFPVALDAAELDVLLQSITQTS